MDPDDAKLYDALRNADKSGDSAGAARLADYIKTKHAAAPAQAEATAAEDAPDDEASPPSAPDDFGTRADDNSFVSKLYRGVRRLPGAIAGEPGKREALLKGSTDAVKAVGAGLIRPVGRVGDAAIAAASSVADAATGTDGHSFGQKMDEARDYRNELADEHPVATLGGEVYSGGKAIEGAMGASKVIMPTATKLSRLLAAGAAVSGASSAANGNNASQVAVDTGVGGLANGAVSKIVDVVSPIARNAAAMLMARFSDKAATTLAAMKAAGKVSPQMADQIETAINAKQAATGRPASLAEVADPAEQLRLNKLAANKKEIGVASRAADDANVAALPDRMQQAVAQGGPIQSKVTAKGDIKRSFDATMAADGGLTTTLTPDEINTFIGTRAANSMSDALRARLTQAANDGTSAFLTTREADTLRRAFKAAKTAAGNGTGQVAAGSYDELEAAENSARSAAGRASPRYARTLDEAAHGNARIEGMDQGEGVLSKATTTDNAALLSEAQQNPNFGADTVNGVQTGTRTALHDTVAEGPGSALAATKAIASNGGLQARMTDNLPAGEAARLVAKSQAETASAEALGNIRPEVRPEPDVGQRLKEAVRGGLAVTGAGGGFAKVNAVNGVLGWFTKLGLPPVAARKTAQMLFTPGGATQVIDKLRAIGVQDNELKSLALAIEAGTQGADKSER